MIAYSGREGPSESGQFQGLPEAILSCLPSCLRSALQDGMFQSRRKLLHNTALSGFSRFKNYIKMGGNSGGNRRGIGGQKMKDGPGQNTVYPCMKISNNKEKE